jgi:hypothetical protein
MNPFLLAENETWQEMGTNLELPGVINYVLCAGYPNLRRLLHQFIQ